MRDWSLPRRVQHRLSARQSRRHHSPITIHQSRICDDEVDLPARPRRARRRAEPARGQARRGDRRGRLRHLRREVPPRSRFRRHRLRDRQPDRRPVVLPERQRPLLGLSHAAHQHLARRHPLQRSRFRRRHAALSRSRRHAPLPGELRRAFRRHAAYPVREPRDAGQAGVRQGARAAEVGSRACRRRRGGVRRGDRGERPPDEAPARRRSCSASAASTCTRTTTGRRSLMSASASAWSASATAPATSRATSA